MNNVHNTKKKERKSRMLLVWTEAFEWTLRRG